MKTYFAYTRVSTVKQGTQGVSLQEQRAAIEAYCARQGLTVSQWFEERETAAKSGRPIFERMLSLLRQEKAAGVVIHKIDRSARNLRDWSDLGEAMDGGIEVYFANESLDLNSRGGRLSADIQAVVAADYIRNLRDETIKGMRGRYKQGLFPLPAPIGYLDRGGGQPKGIDPVQGPLVKKMFELYASAQYGHIELAEIMYDLGLRTKRGGKIGKSTIAWLLANPFYCGLVRLKSTNQVFEGKHQALISHSLFKAAREVSSQRLNKRVIKHEFTFRRFVRCGLCGYNLTGERVKGITYYRCHTPGCSTTSIREERLMGAVVATFAPLEVAEDERHHLSQVIDGMSGETQKQREDVIRSMQTALGNIQERTSRLADAYLDGIVDRTLLQDKQKALLEERKAMEERLEQTRNRHDVMSTKLKEFIEFASSVRSVFEAAAPSFRQQLLRRVVTRLSFSNQDPVIILEKSYDLFASRRPFGSVTRDGEVPQKPSTSNRDDDQKDTANTKQKAPGAELLALTDLDGCPSQDTPRNSTAKFLVEIAMELLETPEDISTHSETKDRDN